MATEVIKTIKSSGGDYTSLSAWEAARNRDLVAANEIEIAECYPFEDTTPCTISGWTTDATRKIIIRTPVGYKHGGKWSTNAYRMVTGNCTAVLTISIGHCIIDGIQGTATPTFSNGNQGVFRVAWSAPDTTTSIIFRNCIAGNTNEFNGVGGGAFYIAYTGSGSNFVVTFVNCLVHNTNWFAGFNNASVAKCSAKAFNCTCAKSSGTQYGSITQYNCISGTDAVTYVDAAGGDYHLATSDTFARGTGTDYSTDIIALGLPVKDIDEQDITTWNKGADAQTTIVVTEIPFEGLYQKKRKTVWTPQDRLNKKLATCGLPAWSTGNDNFTKLLLNGSSLSDVSESRLKHPYQDKSGYFSGSVYLTGSTGTDFNIGAGNFVFKGWFNTKSSAGSYQTIFACDGGYLDFLPSGTFRFNFNGVGTCVWTTSVIGTNTWYHFAVARSGANVRLYLNGALVSAVAAPGTFTNSTDFRIGYNFSVNYFIGSLADICWKSGTDDGYTGTSIPIPTFPVVADQYTKLLLPMSSNLNDTTGKVITPVGDVKIAYHQHPYFPVTGCFDASGDYINTNAGETTHNLQTNTVWTIEFWVNPTNTGATQDIVTKRDSYGLTLYVSSTGNLAAYSSIGGGWNGMWNGTSLGALQFNSWNFVQVSRNGTTYTANINGVQTYTITSAILFYDVDASPFIIAGGWTWGIFKGQISDFRFSNTDRIAATPSAPLTSDAFTKLHLPMNEGAKPIAYDRTNQKSIAVGTSTSIRNCFNGKNALVYVDGNSSAEVAYSTDFNLGNSDFSFEWWMYQDSVVSNIIEINSSAFGLQIANSGGNVVYKISYSGSGWDVIRTIAANETGRWIHMAMCRQGGNIYTFKDGILTDTYNIGSSSIFTGVANNFYAGRAGFFIGKLGWVHFVKGTGLYTSNFTPSINPRLHKNSKLCVMPGESATSFNDFSPSARVVTTNGAAKQTNKLITNAGVTFIPDTTCPVSGRVMKFTKASSTYLNAQQTTEFALGKIYTIDFWMNGAVNGTQYLLTIGNGASANGFGIGSSLSSNIFIASDGFNNNLSTSTRACLDSSWHHIAVVSNGTRVNVYIDGVFDNQIAAWDVSETTYGLQIGSYMNAGTRTHYYDGKMTQLRISKGIARWTSNFTPPTKTYEVK